MQNSQIRLIALGRDRLWVRNWPRQLSCRKDLELVSSGVCRLCRWEQEDVHWVFEHWQLVGVEGAEAEAPMEHFDGLLDTVVEG